jgi:purine-binding chemotaxis protein CheW
MSEAGASSTRALTFRVGESALAIPAGDVAEVVRALPVTRTPLAPPGLLGVANVRGRVAPILSLRRLLGDAADGRGGQVVVLAGDDPVGLAVDRVTGLAELPADADAWVEVDALLARALAAASTRRAASRSGVATAVAALEPASPFLAFDVAGQAFAAAVDVLDDVARVPPDIAVLPGGDDAMLGAVELRGAILPVVSLRVLLGFAAAPSSPAARLLVMRVGAARVAFLVDRVRAVVRLRDREIEPAPRLLNRGGGEARIDRVARSADGLLAILAPEQLFDAATLETLQAEGEAVSAAAEESGILASFLRFRLGAEPYALPAEAVTEVIRAPRAPTPTPHAPAFVVGLMNHRGAVLPLIDQRRRFGAPATRGGGGRVIVTRVGDLAAGLLVDGVDGVVRVTADNVLTTGGGLPGDAALFERAIRDADGSLVLVAEASQLLDQAERDMVRDRVKRETSAA